MANYIAPISNANQIAFMPDTNRHHNRFEIPSSDGSDTYVIAQANNTDQWQCGCPAWVYQKGPMADRVPCKHLLAMSAMLNQIGGHAPAALPAAGRKPLRAGQPAYAPRQAPAVAAAPAPAALPAAGKDAAAAQIAALVATAERDLADAQAKAIAAQAKLDALRLALKAAA